MVSLVVALVLAGCGGSDDAVAPAGSSGAGTPAANSAAFSASPDPQHWPVHVGEYPFSQSLRCYGVESVDDADGAEPMFAPGCVHVDAATRTLLAASLLGRDAVLHADDNVTLRYRGAALHRDDRDDPANPELLGVVAFFDVTFPESPFRRELSGDGLDGLSLSALSSPHARGTGRLDAIGTAPRSSDGVTLTDEAVGGQTFTFVYQFMVYGPPAFTVGDPTISVEGRVVREGARGDGRFAVAGQDPDAGVLADVRDSIVRLADALGVAPDVVGAAWFEHRFGSMLASGDPIGSYDRRGAAPADDDGGVDAAADGTEPITIPPPPSPPTTAATTSSPTTEVVATSTVVTTAPPEPAGGWREHAAAVLPGTTSALAEPWDAATELFAPIHPDGAAVPDCMSDAPGTGPHVSCFYVLEHRVNSLEEWAGGAVDHLEVAAFTVMVNAGEDPGAIVVRLGSDDRGIDPSDPSFVGWIVTDVWLLDGDPPDWVPAWY